MPLTGLLPKTIEQGYYCPAGSAIYKVCPAGYYCPAGSASNKACPGGQYMPYSAYTYCFTCPAVRPHAHDLDQLGVSCASVIKQCITCNLLCCCHGIFVLCPGLLLPFRCDDVLCLSGRLLLPYGFRGLQRLPRRLLLPLVLVDEIHLPGGASPCTRSRSASRVLRVSDKTVHHL